MKAMKDSQIRRTIPLLITVCLFNFVSQAKDAHASTSPDAGRTGTKYVFLATQSTVMQTGGIAAVHETYSIQGEFYLTVNFDEGTAFFDVVDAELVGESPFLPTRSLDEIFNMTGLICKFIDKTRILFLGQTTDGTDGQIVLLLTATEQGFHLIAGLTPRTSDLYTYAIEAFAKVGYTGSGTAEDPYQIATAADLIALGGSPEDYDKHFLLTADIDLDGALFGRRVFDKAVIAPDTDAAKSGFQGTSFTGVFDGNGHTISHLNIVGGYYLGLFGQLASGAEVRNLGVVDVKVTASGQYVAGLVGYNNRGKVIGCYSTGSVGGTGQYVGSLVGYNYYGSITASYSTGSVSGTGQYVGGLVGLNYGSIATSYSTATVGGTGYYVGGLVGLNYGSIATSYSAGTVSGTNYVGGLVGSGSATNSYSTAPVKGYDYVGGLVGSGSATNSCSTAPVSGNNYVGGLVGSGSATNSYSTAAVNGNNYVGGLVGSGSATRCYSTGVVKGNSYVGGLTGSRSPSGIRSSVWDIETSGLSGSAGAVGLTTVEMMDPYMLGLNGFANDPNWVLDAGRDYPRLAWEGTPGQIIPEPSIDWLEGGGTAEDPYRIDTAEQLIFLGRASALFDRHFVLGADIDLDPNLPARQVFAQAVIPLFMGVFDGNGHKISRLTVKGGRYLGLFGQLGSGGEVRNLGVADVKVTGSGQYVGGLVGYNSAGKVIGCYSTGAVNGSSSVGGLVGSNAGSITTSYSTGTVTGGSSVGGLVGNNSRSITTSYSTGTVSGNSSVGGLVGGNSGSITASWSTGTLSGTYNVGGLVGYNSGSITTSRSTGTVSGTGSYVGGLVGDNSNNGGITTSYSTGTVTGGSSVGGLVGQNYSASITTSYSTGAVNGNSLVGGLVGYNSNNGGITTSYSTGTVTGGSSVGGLVGQIYSGSITTSYSTGSVSGTSSYVGGLLGFMRFDAVVTQSFWDIQTSGQTTSAGGTGLTTAEMQDINTFLKAGWDFVDEVANGTCDYWQISPGDYPRLRYPAMPQGSGTPEQPYLIRDARDLGTVWVEPMAHYRLEASLDLSGITWSIAVVPWFGGTFDGNGHTISHLTINGGSYLGLFGQLGSGAVVKDLGIVDGNIAGSGNYIGGLVGYNYYGSITTSHSKGTVSGGSSVGGLVGYNSSGSITTSYSTATVSGKDYVGGLVGYKYYGTITSSYSTGTVSGSDSVGGLVGYNYGTVTRCYSTGAVSGTDLYGHVGGLAGYNGGTVTYCFWDIGTSGQATSAGGTGKTTVEMRMAKTFLDARWDFAGEATNGTQDVWTICEGLDYPKLAWQFVIGDFDADADTDFADFCILAEHWLAADGSFWCGAGGRDLTDDGLVNWQDLMVFAENWLATK